MAACKCKYCQTRLTTNNAYKTTVKDKVAYFCNEEHHKFYLNETELEGKKKEYEKQMHEKFYNIFCDILGVNGITNTALWKEKSEINKAFSDERIIAYLEENKEWLTGVVSRLNGGIYGKIRYVGTVLKNSLDDYKPQAKESEKFKTKVDETFYEPM